MDALAQRADDRDARAHLRASTYGRLQAAGASLAGHMSHSDPGLTVPPPQQPGGPSWPPSSLDPWRRALLSLAVAAMGLIDLLSALLSHPPERLRALLHIVPTAVLDTSRTYTLLAGALLLVTAWGLRRGKRRAFVAALFLCALSVPVNLLKAFDFEEATVAAALLFLLGVSGDAFRVRSRAWSLAALRSRALGFAVALAVYAVAGCWLLELQHGRSGSLGRAVAEVLYQLFGVGQPALAVPRHQRIVSWFLESISLLGLTGLVGLALAALRPASHRGRHRAEAGRVAALLRAHGDSSVSAFTLAADADYFFSRNGRAVIAYRFESDTLLAIGDPIGPPEELAPLLRDFAAFCDAHDWRFAFFQARPERMDLYRASGWRALHIGEDPVLWTDRFALDGAAVGDVRRMSRKAAAAGIEVRHFLPGRDPFDASADADGLLEQMRAVSSAWLRAHHGSEKGFCVGRFEPQRLREVWLTVAWDPRARRVEGFLTWLSIPARHGWALDLMRRREDSAPGTMELLVVRSVIAARERGDAMLSLSLSALAHVDEPGAASGPDADPTPDATAARSARAAAQAARAREFLSQHLARFYDFHGLFRWKKKFDPEFEDRYLVYPGPLALPQVTLALVRAQSPGGGLWSYLRPAGPPPDRPRVDAGGTDADTGGAPGSPGGIGTMARRPSATGPHPSARA
jgi:phosphatidylglycerol lysyltransferase